MNNHESPYQYNDVNKEIQSFLSSRENRQREMAYHSEQQQDILPLLESLNRTYNEINMALKTENSAALKDVVLKSDVKMSLVCETLLETLRKTVEDKNILIKENQALEKLKRETESKEFNNKLLIDKLRNEIEFKKSNLDEMNRVIQDQKSIMNECKEENNRFRAESSFYKAKIDEIENLRSRANDRMLIYEKELEALGTVIQEKDTRIQTLVNEKREEENKNLNIKTRVAELESILESMNKKMEVKDKNMSLCNSELSKVLCENKRMKADYEKYKESSGYYEGLYNSLNAQNSYLNAQLNKMLKNTEYSKDIDSFIKKYKAKLKKAKKKIKKLKLEKNGLQEKIEDSVCNDTSDMLIKKIEDLNTKNEKYQSRIEKLEEEKKDFESKMKNLTVKEVGTEFKDKVKSILYKPESVYHNNTKETKPILKQYSSINPINEPKSLPEFAKQKPVTYEPTYWSRNTDYINSKPSITKINHFDNVGTEFKTDIHNGFKSQYERNSIANNQDYFRNTQPYNNTKPNPDNTYLKLFNLENDYDHNNPNILGNGNQGDELTREDLAGGFIQDTSIPPVKLNLDYSDQPFNKQISKSNYQPNQKIESISPFNNDSVKLSTFGSQAAERNTKREEFKDNESVESIKTYHTTSTLKEMMAKTDQLVKKFSDLEGKLEKFNEGETVDNLTDKLKTYNSYYSDWNVESNESDYI